MYEAFFGLRSRPFLAAPQTSRYFPATVIENARNSLIRCIERGEGVGLVIGPPGTGKSLLCQMLAEQFDGQFAVALLSSGRLGTRAALLQAILYEMRLPYRGMDEGELRLSLVDYLEPRPEGNDGLVLIVDEAHTMPWRLLEEVRLITNLVRDGQPRVRVILAGHPVLEERFASPRLASFSQRLAARCYLEPLDSVETADYVRAQLSSAGVDPAQLFTDDAIRAVYRATDGIPRLINQVCDHAMILASLGGERRLTSEAIDEAWADLQQLPPPWTGTAARSEESEGVVEFGSLDEIVETPRESLRFPTPKAAAIKMTATTDEQLDEIEEQLSQLAEAAATASHSTSEVELDFPEFGDPFSEEFAEEEVVLDRYAGDIDLFAEVPRVSSWEGRQLGAILQEFESRPAARSTPAPTPRAIAPASQPPLIMPTPVTPATHETFSPASDPVMPEEPHPMPAPSSVTPVQRMVPPRAIPPVREQVAAYAAPAIEQPELIVVEDAPVTQVPQPIVRKLEYRQLFAKLRRG